MVLDGLAVINYMLRKAIWFSAAKIYAQIAKLAYPASDVFDKILQFSSKVGVVQSLLFLL